MTTIKSYTDISQSNVLAEILPLESADMHYNNGSCRGVDYTEHFSAGFMSYQEALSLMKIHKTNFMFQVIPCWSLAALIELLPSELFLSRHYFLEISKMGDCSTPYEIRYYRFREPSDGADFGRITHISYSSQNLVDACYKMIIKLHELNLL